MIPAHARVTNADMRSPQYLPGRDHLPPIFLGPENDICFIQKDRGGILSDAGQLIHSIFADHKAPGTSALFGIKHLCLDFLVVRKPPGRQPPALPKYLMNLESVAIVFTPSKPQRVAAGICRSLIHSYRPKQFQTCENFNNVFPSTKYPRSYWNSILARFLGIDDRLTLVYIIQMTKFSRQLLSFSGPNQRWKHKEFINGLGDSMGGIDISLYGTDEDIRRALLQATD